MPSGMSVGAEVAIVTASKFYPTMNTPKVTVTPISNHHTFTSHNTAAGFSSIQPPFGCLGKRRRWKPETNP
jgi:hypothetical protein